MAEKELTRKEQQAVTRRQPSAEKPVFLPPADIWETPDAIIVQLDMPGVAPQNLDVHVHSGTLVIDGKVDAEPATKRLYAEQRIGDYHREFALSDDLNADAIDAKMSNGVLTLTISKAEKLKPRRIAITAG